MTCSLSILYVAHELDLLQLIVGQPRSFLDVLDPVASKHVIVPHVSTVLNAISHKHLEHCDNFGLEIRTVHDKDRVARLLQPVDQGDNNLGHLSCAAIVVFCLVEPCVDLSHLHLVGLEQGLDLVLERIVGAKLLVDALLGLEHGVEGGSRHGVEKVVDLVLEHVLWELGEGHCGEGNNTYRLYSFNFFEDILMLLLFQL